MSAAALIPSLLPLFVVIAMRRAEERIRRQLSDAGAVSAESAIPLALHRSIDKRRLQGLIGGGAVHQTADSRHFLDTDGWTRYHGNRRRRALYVLSVVVALLGVSFAVFFFMR